MLVGERALLLRRSKGSRLTVRPSFLAYVDLLGTTFTAPTLATGYGAHLAQPLMRKAVEGREGLLSRQEAEDLIERCMRVLFYRDARSVNKVRCCVDGWFSVSAA